MKEYVDQMGRICELSNKPQRIISLVPSQTELLFDLGLDEEVVAITKFCIHPKKQIDGKRKIGGTKKFNFDVIDALEPDLIIGNKEENYQEGIQMLTKKYPVWMSDINDIDDAMVMINSIGTIVDREYEARQLVSEISNGLNSIHQKFSGRVAYYIWKKPNMVAANNTFINCFLEFLGFTNVFSNKSRYPEVDDELLSKSNADFVFLSSEPYPFKDKHMNEFQEVLPDSRICLVDGEMFSWYGSRLLKAVNYFRHKFPSVIVPGS